MLYVTITYKPMAVSFQCMTKFTTNKKKEKKLLYDTQLHAYIYLTNTLF